jgi:glyoxylate carboligase
MKAMGAEGVKVTEPAEIRDAFEWAVTRMDERQVPVLVEILVAREDDAAMGTAIDSVHEFEPVEDKDWTSTIETHSKPMLQWPLAESRLAAPAQNRIERSGS